MRARAIILSLGLALPALAIAGQAASGCLFSSADDGMVTFCFGCKAAASASATATGTGGMGGTSSTTGTGGASSSSMSGAGGMPQCKMAATCPATPQTGPCAMFATATCVGGKCGFSYAVKPTPSQKYGSCQQNLCGADGKVTQVADPGNAYDDGNQCTQKGCSDAGVPELPVPLTTGTPCKLNGMTAYCEPDPYSGVIACLECNPLDQSTCAGSPATPHCVKGHCLPAHCDNGAKDLGETDMDCGGPCLKCIGSRNCLADSDCASGTCSGGTCAAPTCPDGNQNQDETDVDCGGQLCAKRCADSKKCALPGDCQSGVCAPPMPANGMPNTCQPPSCTDGVQNRDETGVDCGGVVAMCPPCP